MSAEIQTKQLKAEYTDDLFDLTEANRSYLKEWLPWLDEIKSSTDTKEFISSIDKAIPHYAIFIKVLFAEWQSFM